jgi:mono/diheme cytochrome c family protein
MFHVVTMGAGKMPSYAVQLGEDDRWKIVTYVRTSLQGLPEIAP